MVRFLQDGLKTALYYDIATLYHFSKKFRNTRGNNGCFTNSCFKFAIQSCLDKKAAVGDRNVLAATRRVAKNSQRGGGLFWKLETTVNELDPNFHQSWISLRRFFCQNQVISKKKKVFTQIQSVFLTNFRWGPGKTNFTFQVQITASPSQLLLPNPVGGAIFIFGAKIGLKSTKSVVVCILFRPILFRLKPPLATPLAATPF